MARLTIARAALATAAALGLTLALAAPGSAETDVYHVDGQVGWLFDNVTAPREGVSDLERNLLGNVNGRLAESSAP